MMIFVRYSAKYSNLEYILLVEGNNKENGVFEDK